MMLLFLVFLSPGDPPNRAYSHSDVSATCDPDNVTSNVPSAHAQARGVTRSDLGLERDIGIRGEAATSEIRITENINMSSSAR